MSDFLDGDIGDFDWGPRRRSSLRRGSAATVHFVLMILGAAVLLVGLTWAWVSAGQPAEGETSSSPSTASRSPEHHT